MLDQAQALRTLVRDRLTSGGEIQRPIGTYTLAVTSGKGGVGKTSLAVNLALLLARSGRTVRLVDADFGLANAEVLMGVTPAFTLNDVMQKRVDASKAWTEAPGGVKLLSCGSGLEEMANIDSTAGAALLDQVMASASDGDVIVIDTGPGIDDTVVSVLGLADEVMIVTTPEPTSLSDTYAAIKILLSRSADANITLVANCCTSPAQASALAGGIDAVCKRFLDRGLKRHEYLPSDAAVGWAIRIRKPLVLSQPHSPAISWLRKIAIRLEERIRSAESRYRVGEI